MYTASIIFELLGDGDLAVTFPSDLRAFLCHEFLHVISMMNKGKISKKTPLILIFF